jgi:hypothetical protein
MQDELTALGRDRWRGLADEAARERRARTVAPEQRVPVRGRVATVLVALADRLAPALRETGVPDASVPSAGQL